MERAALASPRLFRRMAASLIVIDEFSMLAKDFFALLSRNVGVGKVEESGHDSHSRSFGGINVIICGDLHQSPLVARPLSGALYYPSVPGCDSIDSQLGRAIYEEFSTVVILKEQMVTPNFIEVRDFTEELPRLTKANNIGALREPSYLESLPSKSLNSGRQI